MSDEESRERARLCAGAFRSLGLVPLPSKEKDKRPDLTEYAIYRDQPVPDSWFRPGCWSTSNIQLLTGCHTSGATKILVVDCDGEGSFATFSGWIREFGMEDKGAWVVNSPSGGRHVYFRVPEGYDHVPSRRVWGVWDTCLNKNRGDWLKHQEVRILGEGSLVVAPPSIHTKHPGKRYAFMAGHSPKEFRLPAFAPGWLVEMPGVAPPMRIHPYAEQYQGAEGIADELVAKLSPEAKLWLVSSWGLRITGRTWSSSGWIACFAVNREEKRPSAGFNVFGGNYSDRGSNYSTSLYGLAVDLGVALDRRSALALVKGFLEQGPYQEAAGLAEDGGL